MVLTVPIPLTLKSVFSKTDSVIPEEIAKWCAAPGRINSGPASQGGGRWCGSAGGGGSRTVQERRRLYNTQEITQNVNCDDHQSNVRKQKKTIKT